MDRQFLERVIDTRIRVEHDKVYYMAFDTDRRESYATSTAVENSVRNLFNGLGLFVWVEEHMVMVTTEKYLTPEIIIDLHDNRIDNLLHLFEDRLC